MALSSMLKSLWNTAPDRSYVIKYAEAFVLWLFQAIKKEKNPHTMTYQVLSLKDIIDTVGEFMS